VYVSLSSNTKLKVRHNKMKQYDTAVRTTSNAG
jgi:hypothetical protein